jgi:CheY-specific phosphatase CheX
MNTSTQTLDVRQFLAKHLVDVFETMLSLPAQLKSGDHVPDFPTRVTGSVGFGGETVTGAVYLHLSGEFAVHCASTMLGLPVEEITGEDEVNDVVGEMTNMLAGGLKSALCDAGNACAVSTPAIIRGIAYQIEALPEVQREMLTFQVGENPVLVEVHIKFY